LSDVAHTRHRRGVARQDGDTSRALELLSAPTTDTDGCAGLVSSARAHMRQRASACMSCSFGIRELTGMLDFASPTQKAASQHARLSPDSVGAIAAESTCAQRGQKAKRWMTFADCSDDVRRLPPPHPFFPLRCLPAKVTAWLTKRFKLHVVIDGCHVF